MLIYSRSGVGWNTSSWGRAGVPGAGVLLRIGACSCGLAEACTC